MAKKKPLPKKRGMPKMIYGDWDDDVAPDASFVADPSAHAMVADGERRRVGVYELVGYAELAKELRMEVRPVPALPPPARKRARHG